MIHRSQIGRIILHEPPQLNHDQREIVQRCHEQIMVLSGYDDPVVIATRIDAASGDVHAYEAPYSWSMAAESRPELGLSGLSASVTLVCEGEALWQKRGPAVRVHPGRWSVSAVGGVDPGETMLEGALRELHEELAVALTPEDVEPLGLFHDEHTVRAAYQARLQSRPQIRLNAHEVAEVRWAVQAPGEVGQLSRYLQRLALRACRRITAQLTSPQSTLSCGLTCQTDKHLFLYNP